MMNKWLKRVPVILCSGLFFPVSCTLGTAVSLPVIKQLDARNIQNGDSPHSDFFVLADIKNENATLSVVRLAELEVYKERQPGASFLLNEHEGSFRVNEYTNITYVVLEANRETQLIEAKLKDDDGHVLNRYRARENSVKPLYSTGYFKSYAFIALRNGIALAFALYFLGRVCLLMARRKTIP